MTLAMRRRRLLRRFGRRLERSVSIASLHLVWGGFMTLGFIKNFAFALCAMIALAFVWPISTQAQYASFPCSNGINGAGPGERVIGMGPGGMLMCGYSGEAQPQQSPQQEQQRPAPPPTPKTYTDAFYSVAVHPDATKAWAAARYRNLDKAKKESLAFCSNIMGKGCKIAASGANEVVTIYRVNDGGLEWSVSRWGEDNEKVIKDCFAKGKRCVVADKITSPQIATEVGAPIPDVSYTVKPENNEALRNRYGAIAWTGVAPKIWSSGGHKSRAEAEKAALELCQKSAGAEPQNCKTAIAIGNGIMIVWMDKQKNIRFDSDVMLPDDITPKLTWEHFSKICKSKKPKCALKYLVEARRSGESVKDVI
jgi:hypothetical protein